MLSVKLEGWLLHRGVRKGNSGILLNIYHGIFFSYLCNNPSAFCLLIRLPLLFLLLVFSLFCLSLYLCLWLSLSVSRCKTNIFLCFPFPLSLFFSCLCIFSSGSFGSDAAAKSLQSCPTLCDPRDGSPPGSPVPGIFQARTLEWVAISFSNAWKWKVKVKSLSHVWLLVTPWTAAYQGSPSMGFSRQEYWSGVPLPSLVLMLIHFK